MKSVSCISSTSYKKYKEILKKHCTNLYLKLNSNLHKTDLYKGLNLFLESSALGVLTFVLQNNQEFILMFSQPIKYP